MTLIGTGEINEKYGLDRIQVFRLIEADDWPAPAQELARGRLWDEDVVEAHVNRMLEEGRLQRVKIKKKGRWVETMQVVPRRYLQNVAQPI